ncbi:MAG: ssDNA-binding protein, mitochondrial [Cirrosporium novae-zelandiae]|nr:MAG: ssDNA-binding protein, mitochondrial [Cirrosporium novae-zelandiae]
MPPFTPLRPILKPSLFSTRPLLLNRFLSSTPSRSLARISIVGNLGADPELVATSTGRDVIRYQVATSHGPPDEDGNRKTSWFRVSAFTAEGPGRDYLMGLQKGTKVFVEGDASIRSYEDKEGVKREALNIRQSTDDYLFRLLKKMEANSVGIGSIEVLTRSRPRDDNNSSDMESQSQ